MEKNIPKMTKEITQLHKCVTIWDCESSLYDSFELKSFERQLDRAIASSRTMSMPHLANYNRVVPISSSSSQYSQSYDHTSKKGASKISWSFQKIIKSVFRSKHRSPFSPVQESHKSSSERSNALSSVSEVIECDGLSSDIRSPLGRRRIKSTRFTVTTSC